LTLIAGDGLHIVLPKARREANRLSLSTSLATLSNSAKASRLMEVLSDAADIALNFRILVRLDDERAEEMADQLLTSTRRAAEQAEVPRRSRDIR
jgi:hypothetical protein